MKPLAPETLLQNRYQIINMIGKGGMGEVYLATDKRLGNEVALKRTTVGDDESLAAAFEQEARTLAGLRHPVLPKVSDHFLEGDEQFLVMDFIEGEDLSKRLKKATKPFPLKWVLFWADQLLEALSYLHTHDPPIIHRDIKPQNLKLTPEKQIVLLDFGLSKNALGNTRVTTSGSVVGYTPHYAPIEQIRGTGTNAKSDLYALSATLYQLLTNTVPPDSITRAESLLANLPDPLRSLTEVNPEISPKVAETITKALEISQDRRFADAREMQKALRRAYGTMQESMTAETVAFNLGDEELIPAVSASNAKTEIGIELPIPTSTGHDEAPQTEFPDVRGAVPVGEEPVVASSLDEPASEADFSNDADLIAKAEIDSNEKVEKRIEESDVVETAGATSDTSDEFGLSAVQDDNDAADAPDLAQDAVDAPIPLISEPEDSAESEKGYGDAADNEDGEQLTVEARAAGIAVAVPHEPALAPPNGPKDAKKSSVGKYVAIVFGLGSIIILVLGASAVGLWYYTQGGGALGNENSEEPTPTVESTVEDALPASPSPENVNTENGDLNNENTNSGNVAESPTPGTPPSKDRPTPQTRPTIRKVPATPPRKVPVKPPPTPKPTPKKKDPGVI